MHAARQHVLCKSTSLADPIEVFRERAWAVARLVENHLIADKATAVDGLWKFAEDNGVIDAVGGVDQAQAILAEAFR